MDTLSEGIEIAFAKFREEFGEKAQIEAGDSFSTVFNDAIITIEMQVESDGVKKLSIDVKAGKPYFAYMDLNLTDSSREKTE